MADQLEAIFESIGRPLFKIGSAKVSLFSILVSILVVTLTIYIAKYLGRFSNRYMRDREVDSGVRDSVEKFVRYGILAIGLLFALDNLGISISSLAAVGAILMVGIGFGLQNIAQNFISGIILLLERPIKVGDIVTVGNFSGRVVDIRVRSTIIQTRDDISIIVPNSKFVSEEVINDSYSGQQIRRHVRVGVAYGSDVKSVKSILTTVALAHESVLKDPPPAVVFEDFGESSLNFDLRYWCSNIWQVEVISSDLRTAIDEEFRAAEIEIPFPQRDLHIRSKEGGLN